MSFFNGTVNCERRHRNLHLVRESREKNILSVKNARVCLCLFVWGEQAGLLLIMTETESAGGEHFSSEDG